MPKYRSLTQNRRLFGVAGRLGLTHEDLRDIAFEATNGRTEHTSKLYAAEADAIIRSLESKLPESERRRRARKSPPLRTVQYHRQKAGVPVIATATHIDFMNRLRRKRGISESGLEDLSERVNGGKRKPKTAAEVNRVIEALKAMIRRDAKPAASTGGSKEAA